MSLANLLKINKHQLTFEEIPDLLDVSPGYARKVVADFVEKNYPAIRLVRIVPNSGNSIISVNVGIKAARNNPVICLDNDVKVDQNFIAPLLCHFKKGDVFAVCSKIYNPNHSMRIESFNYPGFYKGRLIGYADQNGHDKGQASATEVWFAPGNGAAYDKDKFLELGGLDPIFRPIYGEDVDVCYRAWQRGWKTLCEPASITYHLSHKTTKKHFPDRYFQAIRLKNQFILTWKNVRDVNLICEHFAWTSARTIFALLKGDLIYLQGLSLAIKQIPEVIERRRKEKGIQRDYSDKGLFKRLQNYHSH